MVQSASLSVRLTKGEFERLSGFIYKECGINLTAAKKVLVESRLQKRLNELKLTSFSDYYDYVRSPLGSKDELIHLIDAIATNKTDFFREPVHFQFMQDVILPELTTLNRPYKVWSSACSTGEEPYTIAMILEQHAQLNRFDYKITATDISTKVLAKGMQAIYPARTVADVDMNFKKRFFMRSKDVNNPTVRIVPGLRTKVNFKRLNLMDEQLDVDGDFDLIFCRNVLIYFDRITQEKVVNKLLGKLRSGGYLFIGHSESIYHMNLRLQQLKPTIFQKP
jgi:chemotaxis protein methyltransferase CheR